MSEPREHPHVPLPCDGVQGQIQEWSLDAFNRSDDAGSDDGTPSSHGALPEGVADHVAHCPNCQRFLEEANTLEASLRALPQQEAPPGFSDRLMSRLDTVETEKYNNTPPKRGVLRPLSRWGVPLTAAAAIALVVMVATPWEFHGPSDPKAQQLIAAAPTSKTLKPVPTQPPGNKKVMTAKANKSTTSPHVTSGWEPGDDIMAAGSPQDLEPWEMDDPLTDLVGF